MFSVKQEVLYAALSPLDHSHTYAHTSKWLPLVSSTVAKRSGWTQTMTSPTLRDMLIPENLSILGFDVKQHLYLLNEQVQNIGSRRELQIHECQRRWPSGGCGSWTGFSEDTVILRLTTTFMAECTWKWRRCVKRWLLMEYIHDLKVDRRH